MNAGAYTRQIRQLFPAGLAWAGEIMGKFAQAIADELARIDTRGVNLIDERDPRMATETLTEWENETGLPDPGALTIAQRRAAVVTRLVSINSQSKQFFLDLAGTLGYSPAIVTYRPFQVGRSRAGETLTNGDWLYTWTVTGDGAGAAELQDALDAKKPSHTILLFEP